MKKRVMRVLCSVLAVVLLVGVFPVTAGAIDFTDNGMSYETNGISYVYNGDTGEVMISGVGGQTASLYGWYTYYNATMDRHDWTFTTFNFGEGITYVGGFHGQFSRDPRVRFTVNLPQSLETIGTHAFYNIDTLKSITLPDNLQVIEEAAFEGSGLTEIRVPAGVWISWRAFDKCEELRTVYLEDGVTMSNGSFRNCVNLTSVRLPADLNGVGGFEGCVNLTDINLPETLTVIEDDAFKNTGISSIEFPEGLLCIDNDAFENTNISSVEFPEGLESICINAFAGTQLTEATIPESVTYIGDGAFPAGEWFTIYGYRNTQAQWFAERNGNTFIPLNDCDIKVSVKEENVESYDTACGTVMKELNSALIINKTPLESFTSTLTVTPDNDSFTNVTLDLTLPEGFSFDPDELVTKKTMYVGSVNDECDVVTDPIYPIYLNDAADGKGYKLTVNISATDSLGEQESGTDSAVFMTVGKANNSFTSTGNALSGETYNYSLDSAIGDGSHYVQSTAELMVLLSDLAYTEQELEKILVREMGFSCFEQYGISNWNTKACGRYIASKQVIVDGEIRNLIYVICRGTISTVGEWWGDFQVGFFEQINDHEGFKTAADYIAGEKGELQSFCKTHEFAAEDNIILVTGHSKGAATANLVGKMVNTSGLANKENIATYTFATPTVSRDVGTTKQATAGYENIFNFVNYQDIIRNAPSMQYYGRYGSTTIFGTEKASAGTKTHTNAYGTYTAIGASPENFTLTELLNGVMYGIDARKFPVPVLLAVTVNTAFNITTATNGTIEAIGADASTAHGLRSYYDAVRNGAYGNGADMEYVRARTEAALKYYNDVIVPKAGLMSSLAPATVIINAFKCPINVYVDDANGNTVASIVDMAPVSNDPNVFVTTGGETRYVMFSEEFKDDYTIRVEGYDNGTITHSVQYVTDSGIESVEQRSGIPVSNGETLTVNSDGHLPAAGESAENTAEKYKVYDDESEISILFPEIVFNDVAESDWFHDTVYAAAGAGLILGGSNNMFMPNDELSWAQAITFAVRLYQYNHGERVYGNADQVGANWYDVYVDYALAHGIISEVPKHLNGIITRGEAAVIFAAVLGEAGKVNEVPEGRFQDLPKSGEVHDAVMALAEAGICNGMSESLFGVDAGFRRSEVATIVARMADLVPKAEINA